MAVAPTLDGALMKAALVSAVALIMCCSAGAQQHPNDTQYPTVVYLGSIPTQSRMTVADIIKLTRAGVSDGIIVQQIVKKGQSFDLSTKDLIDLKNAGVSDRVVQAMMDPKKASTDGRNVTAAPSLAPQPASINTPVPAVPASPPASVAPVPANSELSVTKAFAPVAVSPVVSSNNVKKPRIFFVSASKGSQWNAARSQSMEMSKDFEKDCPGTQITINQSTADYTVLLNHIEHGLVRDNQVQVANRDGDLISKTKEGGSIRGDMKKVCQVILADWSKE